jgi:putative pyruvate formate lyase activating enzyme
MRFVASLSRDTYVNVMDQYRPCHRASEDPRLRRPVTASEYREAVALARSTGLHRFADG